MREVYLSDVTAAARVLMNLPASQRAGICAQMLVEADIADKFRKRLGKTHLLWGNGTLVDVARTRRMAPEKSFSDAVYLSCFMVVLEGLARHRTTKTCKF